MKFQGKGVYKIATRDQVFKQGSHLFLKKKIKNFSRTFKDTFLIFQGLQSVQKRALSLCLF